METWFKVLVSSFIPLIVGLLLPRPLVPVAIGLGVALLVLAVVLMFRQDRGERRPDRD